MFFKSGNYEYEFKYKFSSLKALEKKSGKAISKLMSEENMGFEAMSLFIWAGLIWNNEILSVQAVDKIIDDYIDGNEENDFTDLMEMATTAFEKAGFGAKKKKKDEPEVVEEKAQ
jgi:hypothetical protein